MNETNCEQLDDYLAGGLAAAQQSEFAAHLRNCEACRAEVAGQRRIDALLREANQQVELLPQFDLLVERRIRNSNLRRAAVWAASAALLLAVAFTAGWLIPAAHETDSVEKTVDNIVDVPAPQRIEAPPAPEEAPSVEPPAFVAAPRVVVRPNGGDAIALRVESDHPTVHIYHWLPAQPLATTSHRSETNSPSSPVEDEL